MAWQVTVSEIRDSLSLAFIRVQDVVQTRGRNELMNTFLSTVLSLSPRNTGPLFAGALRPCEAHVTHQDVLAGFVPSCTIRGEAS